MTRVQWFMFVLLLIYQSVNLRLIFHDYIASDVLTMELRTLLMG